MLQLFQDHFTFQYSTKKWELSFFFWNILNLVSALKLHVALNYFLKKSEVLERLKKIEKIGVFGTNLSFSLPGSR